MGKCYRVLLLCVWEQMVGFSDDETAPFFGFLGAAVALIVARAVHRVCITTCFLFSAGLLYEINKISGMA